MVNRGHRSDYDGPATQCCERALVNLIGDIGPWSDRVRVAELLAYADSVASRIRTAERSLIGTSDAVFANALGGEVAGVGIQSKVTPN